MPAEPLVPLRWPAAWKNAAPLRLLASSPFNCVIVDGADTLARLAEPAKQAGIAALEYRSLGAAPLNEVRPNRAAERIVIDGLVWPRIRLSQSRGTDPDAAPTGAPWIDSNSWVARLARVRAPGCPLWLSFERAKEDGEPDRTAYQVAMADSAASGARWIVSLDPALAGGVAAGNTEALDVWRAIAETAAYFEKRRGWQGYQPWGPLGIVSTFAGPNEFMGHELLNLSARRGLLYRVLDRSLAAVPELRDLAAVLWADNEKPSPAWTSALAAFAGGGGLLIVPRTLASTFPRPGAIPCPVAGYEMHPMGKGRLAVATRDQDDPYFLAADVHSLASRRNDPVRLFNGRSLWLHYGVNRGDGSALLQLVGFTSRPRDNVSLAPSRRWRSVAMHTPDSERPRTLEPVTVDGQVEYRLPAFSYYAALEFRS